MKIFIIFPLLLILILLSCTRIFDKEILIKSNPEGAQIYYGKAPNNLKIWKNKYTPYSTNSLPNKKMFFQLKKEGYHDSEILIFPDDISLNNSYVLKFNLVMLDSTLDNKNGQTNQNKKDSLFDTEKRKNNGWYIFIVIFLSIVITIFVILTFFGFSEDEIGVGIFGLIGFIVICGIFYYIDNNLGFSKFSIKSEPSSASIYYGNDPDSLKLFTVFLTPFEKRGNKIPYAKYYQFRKNGYENSKLISRPIEKINGKFLIHAKLNPLDKNQKNVDEVNVKSRYKLFIWLLPLCYIISGFLGIIFFTMYFDFYDMQKLIVSLIFIAIAVVLSYITEYYMNNNINIIFLSTFLVLSFFRTRRRGKTSNPQYNILAQKGKIGVLIRIAKKYKDRASSCASAFYYLRKKENVPQLINILEYGLGFETKIDIGFRANAAYSLGQIGDPRALGALEKAANEHRYNIEHYQSGRGKVSTNKDERVNRVAREAIKRIKA